jgi:hypothetical protein
MAAALPEPSTDWTDVANVRAEWDDQLEGPDKAELGWHNGTRMYQEGVIPAQKLNVAEYITRGLAYHLFIPIISDTDALRRRNACSHLPMKYLPSRPSLPSSRQDSPDWR